MNDTPKSYGAAMSLERFIWLMDKGKDSFLSKEEAEAGWHFCHAGWDGLLIHPVDLEYKSCGCADKQKFKKDNAYYERFQNFTNWLQEEPRDYPFKNLPNF